MVTAHTIKLHVGVMMERNGSTQNHPNSSFLFYWEQPKSKLKTQKDKLGPNKWLVGTKMGGMK